MERCACPQGSGPRPLHNSPQALGAPDRTAQSTVLKAIQGLSGHGPRAWTPWCSSLAGPESALKRGQQTQRFTGAGATPSMSSLVAGTLHPQHSRGSWEAAACSWTLGTSPALRAPTAPLQEGAAFCRPVSLRGGRRWAGSLYCSDNKGAFPTRGLVLCGCGCGGAWRAWPL